MAHPRTLLVAYNHTASAERALRWAVRKTNANTSGMIHVVSVVEATDDDRIILPDGKTMEQWAALDSLRFTVAETVRVWGLKAPGVSLTAHLRSGPRAEAILDLAEQLDVDCIVLGSNYREGAKRLGDTPRRVLAHSFRPVHVEVPSLHGGVHESGAIGAIGLLSLRGWGGDFQPAQREGRDERTTLH